MFAALWAGDTSGYPSHSEADLALANHLVFWCDGDPDLMDQLFRQSALYRAKWDTRRGDRTYGERTIETALAGCQRGYRPASVPQEARPRPGSSARTSTEPTTAVTPEDFYAYMPMHHYIFVPSRELWPASSVNARIAPLPLVGSDGHPPSRENTAAWSEP